MLKKFKLDRRNEIYINYPQLWDNRYTLWTRIINLEKEIKKEIELVKQIEGSETIKISEVIEYYPDLRALVDYKKYLQEKIKRRVF